MKIFDFLKGQPKHFNTPEQALRHLVDYMPDFYLSHRHFINCVEFLSHHEWELALESLIELADETEHYFSEVFWNSLAETADNIKLPEKASYCKKQIARNLRDIKSKTPFGWTTIKIDESHFKHHISEKLQEERATKRRKEDKVEEPN